MHIKADNLSVMRGERVLFKNVSLSAGAGEAILLRGANGSGKTTLLRCLAGLTRPETGAVICEPHHWIGHKSGIKPHETPFDHLYVWATAYGSSKVIITAILEKMALERAYSVPGAQLSAGQRRRTALARTQLTHRPVWLLDEPFAALDADGKTMLGAMIQEHRQNGGTIIAAVHGDVPIPNAKEVAL